MIAESFRPIADLRRREGASASRSVIIGCHVVREFENSPRYGRRMSAESSRSAILRRSAVTCILAAGLTAFALGPRILGLSEEAVFAWWVIPQMAGPLAASILCFIAAKRSEGSERSAWRLFALGAGLYQLGNLVYLAYDRLGVDTRFPAFPELAFFVMAIFFALGMARYARTTPQTSEIRLLTFLLVYGSVVAGCLLLLREPIRASAMDEYPTIVAFLYPALWFSVASYGLMTLTLYDQKDKAAAFAILLVAIFAEAFADFRYALDLMRGAHTLGGVTNLLWLTSACCLCWAALEQIRKPRSAEQPGAPFRLELPRIRAQALIPAAATGLIMLSGSASGAFGGYPYSWLSAGLAATLAAIVGLREYRVIAMQRSLGAASDLNRARLMESEQRLASVLQSTSDSVLVVDREWRVRFFNDRARDLIPELHAVGIGGCFWNLFLPSERQDYENMFRQAMAERKPLELETYNKSRGQWIELRLYPTTEGISLFFRDVSEARGVREELAHLAHHDFLTGLPNRVRLHERLNGALPNGPVALFLLDLDHFKEINDTLGHSVGDALLVRIARQLDQFAGPESFVCRLGGDEFALMIKRTGDRAALDELASRLLAAVAQPYDMDGRRLVPQGSIGIALSDSETDSDQLLKRADIALYVAKAEARGGHRFFESEMESRLRDRQALRADLELALERKEFELHYQPIVDLRSGKVAGFEALLRWRHPVRGFVPPDAFIPAAEEGGLIVAIGDWVLRTACAEAVRWPESVSVAVNLSTRQFGEHDLAHRILAILRTTGLAPGRLEIEITESALLRDTAANLATLRRIRDHGVEVALDDFGTGYSSLGYLQKFQFHKLKIDRAFINEGPQSQQSRAIVAAIVGLGKALGARVTAEGVETREQYDWVARHCHEAQGYYLSRPVPASAVLEVIETLGGSQRGKSGIPERRFA